MLSSIKSYLNDFSHLIFPHNCEGCGTDVLNDNELLCVKCAHQLPQTNFFSSPNNPVEKIFYGRLDLVAAASAYYFTKDSLLQHLLIQLKYRNNKETGFYLGKMMGHMLSASDRFNDVDALIPLPLNPKKEQKRGYNQAAVICDGITEVWNKLVLKNTVIRTLFTETQTQQDRIHRWQNMEGVFAVADEQAISNKHILLIDDVVTTGATLEACGSVILKTTNTKLSIATIAYTI